MELLPPELLEHESYHYLPFEEIYRLRRTSSGWYRTYLREIRRRASTAEPWLFAIRAGDLELFRDLLRSGEKLPFSLEELFDSISTSPEFIQEFFRSLPEAREWFVEAVYGPLPLYSHRALVEIVLRNPEILGLLLGELRKTPYFLLDVYDFLRGPDKFRSFYQFITESKVPLEKDWVKEFLWSWFGESGQATPYKLYDEYEVFESLSEEEQRILVEIFVRALQ